MTNQEIFDKSVAGLASQGFERAYTEGVGCKYRDYDGRKCAIGWLIPDDKYNAGLEGCAASTGTPRAAELRASAGLVDVNPDFIRALQRAHDEGRTPKIMREYLIEVARSFKLRLPDVLRLEIA